MQRLANDFSAAVSDPCWLLSTTLVTKVWGAKTTYKSKTHLKQSCRNQKVDHKQQMGQKHSKHTQTYKSTISTENLNALTIYIHSDTDVYTKWLNKHEKVTVVASLEDVSLHLVVAVFGSEVNLSSTHHFDVGLHLGRLSRASRSVSRHVVTLLLRLLDLIAEISFLLCLITREARKLESREGEANLSSKTLIRLMSVLPLGPGSTPRKYQWPW